jgi:NFU1 iron-sulfur cluster scaffold homolog, mitochondrial
MEDIMTDKSQELQISAESTPNPNTIKFSMNRSFLESGGADFPDAETAKQSPLAMELFNHPDVRGVYIGTNFVTLTKDSQAEWPNLIPKAVEIMKGVLQSGVKVVEAGANVTPEAEAPSPLDQQIRDILDREIRPAVAMDGGDVTFVSFKEGIVKLHLKGSCSSCPSAMMTLKMGVENRLRSLIPEIKEVVQVPT